MVLRRLIRCQFMFSKAICRFVVITGLAAGLYPPIAVADGHLFDRQEVMRDVSNYMNTVFGNKYPTLRDYLLFEGRLDPDEDEVQLELQECSMLFPGEDTQVSKRCGDYMTYRHNNMGKVESLYFRLLREKLAVDPRTMKIEKIESLPVVEDGYRIALTVRTRFAKRRLTLGHVGRRDLEDLWRVGILEVDGKRVQEYLGLCCSRNNRGHEE